MQRYKVGTEKSTLEMTRTTQPANRVNAENGGVGCTISEQTSKTRKMNRRQKHTKNDGNLLQQAGQGHIGV
jgi:hypothetical protein